MFDDHTEAEHRLAACAAETPDGAALAITRVDQHDFIDQRAWRVIYTAPAAHQHTAGYSERLEYIVDHAGVQRSWLNYICALSRRSIADLTGSYAATVIEQGNDRSAAHAALETLQTLTGHEWSSVA